MEGTWGAVKMTFLIGERVEGFSKIGSGTSTMKGLLPL